MTVQQWKEALVFIRKNGPIKTTPGFDESVSTRIHDRPLTVQEMAAAYGIDLDVYEAADITTNRYLMSMKMRRQGGFDEAESRVMWQTKVVWRRKSAVDYVAIKAMVVKELVRKSKPTTPPAATGGLIAEIVISDHHLGKVGVSEPWGIDGAVDCYRAAVAHFAANIPPGVDTILFPTGNDFIHVDNLRGTTTKGTVVEASTNWFKMILAAKELVVEAVQKFGKGRRVYIPMVMGNHDQNSVLALGEILAAQFASDPNVIVMNNPDDRKYLAFGKTVIGWSHMANFSWKGANANVLSDLRRVPGAQDSDRVYFRVGHLHKSSRSTTIMETDEAFSVQTEVMSTLCPGDRWHDDNGYGTNQRRSQMFIYDPSQGLTQTIFYNHGA